LSKKQRTKNKPTIRESGNLLIKKSKNLPDVLELKKIVHLRKVYIGVRVIKHMKIIQNQSRFMKSTYIQHISNNYKLLQMPK